MNMAELAEFLAAGDKILELVNQLSDNGIECSVHGCGANGVALMRWTIYATLPTQSLEVSAKPKKARNP